MFTPDRLAVVKGGPAARRAYLDRSLARLSRPARRCRWSTQRPSGSATPRSGGSRPARRRPRRSSRGRRRSPSSGRELVAARREAIDLLGAGFAERAGELGLAGAALALRRRAADRGGAGGPRSTVTSSGASTGLGPAPGRRRRSASGDRDLRIFGSQGEQRLAVLALLLAEAELLAGAARPAAAPAARRRAVGARRGAPPDPQRADRARGQAVVTATGAEALPLAPAQLLAVTPGEVRRRLMERLGGRGQARPARRRRARTPARWRRSRASGPPPSATRSRARPGRCGCPGTGRCTSRRSPSAWAFELDLARGRDPGRSSARRSATTAPTALRFAPGPVPAPGARRPRATAAATAAAGPEERRLAAELSASLRSRTELRETVARAAAASLARAASRPTGFLIDCRVLTKARFAGLFL